jgi:hypothetical protein
VTVTTVHNREVLLLLSTEKGRDGAFVERLVSEGRKRVPEGEERLLVSDESGAEVRTFTLS